MNPKYPRTFHLPWSPGGTSDDRRLPDVEHFFGEALTFTEKMDGSNVCLEARKVVARSHAAPPRHPSFDALKAKHAEVKGRIPDGTQVFGEWCWARHSIEYTALPGYLMIFGVRCGDEWVSWDEVQLWAQELQSPTVPMLAQHVVSNLGSLRGIIDDLTSQPSACGGPREGVVIRVSRAFRNHEFGSVLAKWVRKGHIQTDDHWSHQEIVRNRLAVSEDPV